MEFKPQVIFFDKSKEQTKIGNARIAAEKINKIFEEVDSVLKIKPTKEKRVRLVNEGYGYVLDELKANFPFPNATEEFNFNAMGIDPSPFKELLRGISINISEHRLHIKGTKMEVTEQSLKEIKEDCTVWTKNAEQNEKYEFAQKLCSFLNKNEKNMQKYCKVFASNNSVDQRGSKNLFNGLVMSEKNGEEQRYVPAPPRV